MHLYRRALLVAGPYLVLSLWLSGVRPLWLDEILQLMDTRQPSAAALMANLPMHHVGSAPLGYLTQQAALKVTGYSLRRARLTAAIFGAAAVVATMLLAAELGLAGGWAASIILAAFPLTIRYGSEGRMYSQALFFSVLATWLYVRLTKRPGWLMAAAYAAALALAVHTQPYAAAGGLAHVLWSFACRQRLTAAYGAAAAALAAVSFLPWLWFAHSNWSSAIASGGLRFHADLKTPLMLIRELTGAGYIGSALLFALCAAGEIRRGPLPRAGLLLILLVAVTVAAVLVADAWFGYFLAARQFLWVLPPLAILAGSAVRRNKFGPALGGLLVAVCIWHTTQFFTRQHENWQVAAAAIHTTTCQGACLAVAPREWVGFYKFFHPDLDLEPCDSSRLIVVVTPYSSEQQQQRVFSDVRSRNYRPVETRIVGGSKLVLFQQFRPVQRRDAKPAQMMKPNITGWRFRDSESLL